MNSLYRKGQVNGVNAFLESGQVQWDKTRVMLPVQHEPIVVHQRNLRETD